MARGIRGLIWLVYGIIAFWYGFRQEALMALILAEVIGSKGDN